MNKHILFMATLLLLSMNTQAADSTHEGAVDPDIKHVCDTMTHNIIQAYKQAAIGVPINVLVEGYPQHKIEILSGYKMYVDGYGEDEAYKIFHEYCLSVVRKS